MSPEKGHVVHVNSATLLMGVTGSGKSALLGTLAEYVWQQYRKVTRLYTSDGGGFPSNVQALMQKGIVQVFRMRTRDLADGSLSFETCLRSTQGWWPQRITPATGEVPPGVKMVPPITERYALTCPNGHLVKAVPFQSLLTPSMCPTCKLLTDKANGSVTKTAQITPGFDTTGAVCYDGLTSMLSWMMSDMSQRSGRLELKGEEGAIGGKINSGDLKIGGSSRSHYGFAQSRAEEMVLNALGIPNLVVPPVFTALTMETMDEGELSVRGPLLIGKAKTAEAGAWFGDCLEAMVLKTDKDERMYRLCLSEFVDAASVRHLVKNRAAPGTMPAFLEDPPLKVGTEADTAFTNFNLGVFFTLRDRARVVTEAAMDEKYPDAPGLPEGIVEVGEGVASEGSAAPAGTLSTPKPHTGGASAPAVSGKPSAPSGMPKAPQATAPRAPMAAPRPQPPKPPAAVTAAVSPAKPAPPEAPTAAPAVAPASREMHAAPGQPAGSLAGTPTKWAAPAAARPPAPAPRVGPRKP